MSVLTPSDGIVSEAGRAAHELGLAGLLGGNLYGRLAMHPAVERISDPRERGEVVNAAWRRYGTVNTLSLLAVAVGWFGARAEEARGRGKLTARERQLARVKDGLVAAMLVSGAITAIEGIRFSKQAPGGAVPLRDGSHPDPSASPEAARLKKRLNVLGATAIALEAGLVAIDAALSQENYRSSPLRRRFRRWG